MRDAGVRIEMVADDGIGERCCACSGKGYRRGLYIFRNERVKVLPCVTVSFPD